MVHKTSTRPGIIFYAMAIIDYDIIIAEKSMPRLVSTMLDKAELCRRCDDEKYAKVCYPLCINL